MVHSPRSLEAVLKAHQQVFTDELGTVNATIHVDPDATPRFFKARSLPFSLKKKVEQELERLQQQGVIAPVQLSDSSACNQ